VEAGVQHAFDALVICTGTNTWASLPKFKGQEDFAGKVMHSENYKKPDVFAGQRVLIVGAGESGSDICNEVAQFASKVAIVVRGKHGHLIPRKQADGRVTDLNTNRVRYSNPYVFLRPPPL
jgi:dimethylaniline monooxygenase (N-oxide forming)